MRKYAFTYTEANYGTCIIFLFGWNNLINVLVNVFCRMREKEMQRKQQEASGFQQQSNFYSCKLSTPLTTTLFIEAACCSTLKQCTYGIYRATEHLLFLPVTCIYMGLFGPPFLFFSLWLTVKISFLMILTSIFILINIFSSYFIFFYLIHKPVLLIAYCVNFSKLWSYNHWRIKLLGSSVVCIHYCNNL